MSCPSFVPRDLFDLVPIPQLKRQHDQQNHNVNIVAAAPLYEGVSEFGVFGMTGFLSSNL